MKVLVVLGHPSNRSFNYSIAVAVVQVLQDNGHEVTFHNLHEEGFDPILEAEEIPRNAALEPAIRAHCDELTSADGIVVVHPDWWGMPPAILKGWLDRVFRVGVAYHFIDLGGGIGKASGLLKTKAALVFNTSNTPKEIEMRVYGDPLEGLWKTCIFGMCGVQKVCRKMYGPINISTREQRNAWLDEVRETVSEYFPKAT